MLLKVLFLVTAFLAYADATMNSTQMEMQLAVVTAELALLKEEGGLPSEQLDIAWLIIGGTLVEFMQAGFVMLEVGSLRAKNTRNVLVMSLVDDVMAALGWWATGWAFAYGSGNSFIGYDDFGMATGSFFPDGTEKWVGIQYARWFFQYAFAATACTIVSGAVAERLKFSSYLLYSFVIPSFIYPVVAHWAWSADGWASPFIADHNNLLFGSGLVDYAGCTVVHIVGGISALVAVILTGPRKGRFDDQGKPVDLPQQNATFQCLGTFILWLGWYGFNACSTGGLGGGLAGVAAKIAANTTVSAGGGCLSALLLGYLLEGHVDVGYGCNGILAGLVAITSGCATSEPWAAVVIGIIGGAVYVGASKLVLRMGLDDAVDAIAVHLANGVWGVIAAALFCTEENFKQAYFDLSAENLPVKYGLFYGGGGEMLACAIVMILATFAWAGGLVFILFFTLNKCGGIRVDAEIEERGLDVSLHGGLAYSGTEGLEALTANIPQLLRLVHMYEKLDQQELVTLLGSKPDDGAYTGGADYTKPVPIAGGPTLTPINGSAPPPTNGTGPSPNGGMNGGMNGNGNVGYLQNGGGFQAPSLNGNGVNGMPSYSPPPVSNGLFNPDPGQFHPQWSQPQLAPPPVNGIELMQVRQ